MAKLIRVAVLFSAALTCESLYDSCSSKPMTFNSSSFNSLFARTISFTSYSFCSKMHLDTFVIWSTDGSVFSVDASLYEFNGDTQGALIVNFPSMSGSGSYSCFSETSGLLAPSSWPDDVQMWKLVTKITCKNYFADCPIRYAIEVSRSSNKISGCESSCWNWGTCPDGYTLKSGASTIVGDDVYSCCDRISSCSDWNACPPGYVLKSGASSIPGSSQDVCCSQTCAGWDDCGSGFTLKAYAASILGSDSSSCCTEAATSCSDWDSCPSGYALKAGSSSIYGTSQSICCSQTCAGWNDCGSGFTLKAYASSILGSDSSSCCTQAATSCSDWDSCPSGYVLKAGSSSIYGTSQSICCSQTCAGWNGCSSGFALRSDAASTIGSDSFTCCTQGSSAQNDCRTAALCKAACGVGLSFSSNTVNGQTRYMCQKNGLDCCTTDGKTLCSGWNGCTTGSRLRDDASKTYGSSLSECCSQTCASWDGCSSGLVLRSDAASIVGSDSYTCCTQGSSARNDCSTAALCKAACGVGSFSFSSNTSNGQTQYTCQLNGMNCCRANGQTFCSGWNGCTKGFELRDDASNIYGTSVSECCVEVVRVSNSLPSFGTVNEFVFGFITLLYFFSPVP